MEQRRRLHRNKLINEIREIESFISRSELTITRIKNTNMGVEYIKNQINKLKTAISEKNELLEKKKIELNGISAGLSDTVINEEYRHTNLRQKQQTLERNKQKKSNDEEKNEKKEISQQYWKGIVSDFQLQKQNEREYKYGLKYFHKTNDQIPDYMKRNLSEMPNNKGYIWRGIHFYGDLPEQSGPRVMFEKKKGGILVIHEYTDREYKRYEKKDKDRKHLVHKESRNQKNMGVSLIDYIK